MKFKYIHHGEPKEIPLTDTKPTGKRLAVHHNGQIFYAPFVASDAGNAAPLSITFDGGNYSLAAGSAETFEPLTFPELVEGVNVHFNHSDPTSATAVTVLGNAADFGVQVDDSPQGAEIYDVASITATHNNSSIVGNDLNNYITFVGGERNFVVCGLAGDDGDSVCWAGGGVIADMGVGATQSGAAKPMASVVTSSYYDRYNHGSYRCHYPRLYIGGTITGIFIDNRTTVTKRIPTFDAWITYTDSLDADHVILMPDVCKKASTTNASSPTTRAYNTNYNSAKLMKIHDATSGTDTLTVAKKEPLTHDFSELPTSLRSNVIALYNMYNASGFYNSRVDDGVEHQIFPDWVPTIQGGSS